MWYYGSAVLACVANVKGAQVQLQHLWGKKGAEGRGASRVLRGWVVGAACGVLS